MAVDVKFSVCQGSNCKTINFKETTGLYDAASNTTGWGAPGGADPNEMVSDATAATLTITGPDGTVYPTIDLFATGSYPKSDSTTVSIAATTLSSTMEKFADGQWEMTYAVTTGTTTYTETITFFFACQIEACICKAIGNLDVDDCTCKEGEIERVMQMKAFSYALQYAVGCGNIAGANEILKTLQRMCECC